MFYDSERIYLKVSCHHWYDNFIAHGEYAYRSIKVICTECGPGLLALMQEKYRIFSKCTGKIFDEQNSKLEKKNNCISKDKSVV